MCDNYRWPVVGVGALRLDALEPLSPPTLSHMCVLLAASKVSFQDARCRAIRQERIAAVWWGSGRGFRSNRFGSRTNHGAALEVVAPAIVQPWLPRQPPAGGSLSCTIITTLQQFFLFQCSCSGGWPAGLLLLTMETTSTPPPVMPVPVVGAEATAPRPVTEPHPVTNTQGSLGELGAIANKLIY